MVVRLKLTVYIQEVYEVQILISIYNVEKELERTITWKPTVMYVTPTASE